MGRRGKTGRSRFGLVVRAGVCFSVGLLVSVLVALWFAARSDMVLATSGVEFDSRSGAPWGVRSLMRESTRATLYEHGRGARRLVLSHATGGGSYTRYSFGWPFRCLYFEEAWNSPTKGTWASSIFGRWAQIDRGDPNTIQFPDWTRRGSAMMRRWIAPGGFTRAEAPVPLGVAPLGMLANSLAYGTFLWFLLSLATWLSGWRRRRAGRCVACGYDLAELTTCPECGEVRDA